MQSRPRLEGRFSLGKAGRVGKRQGHVLRGGTEAAVYCGTCSCVGAGLEGRVATPKPLIPSMEEGFRDHLPDSDSGVVTGSPFILPGPRTQLSNALSFIASYLPNLCFL